MSDELPKPAKPLDPDDYISHHMARQQGDCPQYGDLLEDGKNPMAGSEDVEYSEWIAEKNKTQEDLQVERMPYDEIELAPEDIPYG